MKVLIYGNRKQDDEMYDISTPEKEAAAYLVVFKTLDEDWQVYIEVEGKQKELYEKAKKGDSESAKKLMNQRKSYEYEEIRIGEVIDPLTLKDEEEEVA